MSEFRRFYFYLGGFAPSSSNHFLTYICFPLPTAQFWEILCKTAEVSRKSEPREASTSIQGALFQPWVVASLTSHTGPNAEL